MCPRPPAPQPSPPPKQVRRYLLDDDLRTAARERVQEQIGPDTHVLIGHSLGSVIAYEALCAMPGHPVEALVTLGSPLGMRMVFDRLLPRPGDWPDSSRQGQHGAGVGPEHRPAQQGAVGRAQYGEGGGGTAVPAALAQLQPRHGLGAISCRKGRASRRR
ncbi:alpha/beta fold hydrolase [Streptomyces sp. NPDC056930]|uniref:alpha/beta fold hydrolase n=1 Tax=Streptomyces sp. NPDC056930 TaxID=3345967 RepID=UPI00363F05CC